MAQTQPYGDIFFTPTPALDRLGEHLYQEQKVRELRHQQENQALGASLQKEFGQIRSVDVPEVITNYEKYKAAKKDLLFNKELHKDPIGYAKKQQEANELLADTYAGINASKEHKKRVEQLVADKIAHPLAYGDDAAERILAYQQTPLSQLRNHPKYGNLTDLSSYLAKGPDTDFSKIFLLAAGTAKPVYSERVPVDKQGLQEDVTEYSFGNTPLQYRDYVLGALSQRKAGRDASALWKNIPQSEKDAVNQAFANTPKEKWQRAGIGTPQELPTDTGNDAVDFANFQAKKYFLANEPKAGAPKRVTNESVKGQLQFDRQRKLEAIRHADAADLIRLRKDINPNDTELNNQWVDSYIENRLNEAENTQPGAYKLSQTGETLLEPDIPLDPVISKALSKQGIEPSYLRVTKDGNFRPIYLEHDKDKKPIGKGGKYAVDVELSRPISREQLRLALGYKGVTKKNLGKEVIGHSKTGKEQQSAATKAEELLNKYLK